ncbi:MAG: TraB/GumN family protein, partial [Methanoregula sp.]|nr:TraB/GumN family protein [Methanoregula sp.]
MAEIKIIGTAHVSQESVDEVRLAIDEYKPDIVAIELDQSRYSALKKQGRDPSVSDVLEVKNFNTLLVQWLMAYLQRKIGFDVGVEPGAEMKAAIEEAEKRGIPIGLVDRDIRLTLMRFWNAMGFFEKMKMIWALVISIAEVDNGQEIDIESLKQQDMIDMVMA